MHDTTHHTTRKIFKKNESSSEDIQATTKHAGDQKEKREMDEPYPDYPLYPPSEDIYSNSEDEENNYYSLGGDNHDDLA